MSNSASTPLFACSRCFSRHPFEELSPGEQLCKECRGSFPVVKCTYCRSEFQQTSKSNTSSICKKCEANVKAYGKPTACEYCNIIAAFIGNKCQRCTNSERKYGPAVTCEQCKQRCAFDRHDDSKKVDGKLLCWLCTQSLKRALARTKQHLSSVDKHKHRSHKLKSSHKEKRKSDMMKSIGGDSSHNDSQPLEKKSKMNPLQGEFDPNSSDHVVAMTQLKETIASLQKKVQQKDNELLAKDKLVWDDELAAKAARWASQDSDKHNPNRSVGSGRFTVGENLYWYSTTDRNYKFNVDEALKSWFNEHQSYEFGPLRKSDFRRVGDDQIGHYTQMAWADTIYVGCALAHDVSQSDGRKWYDYFVVCNYGPTGNYLSRTPYEKGVRSSRLLCGTNDCSKLYGQKC